MNFVFLLRRALRKREEKGSLPDIYSQIHCAVIDMLHGIDLAVSTVTLLEFVSEILKDVVQVNRSLCEGKVCKEHRVFCPLTSRDITFSCLPMKGYYRNHIPGGLIRQGREKGKENAQAFSLERDTDRRARPFVLPGRLGEKIEFTERELGPCTFRGVA